MRSRKNTSNSRYSSSCKLIYRTATRTVRILGNHRDDTESSPAKITEPSSLVLSAQSSGSTSIELVQDHAVGFGEATVIDMGSANVNRRAPTSTQEPRQGSVLWELPWDEEELKHFKRVQIPDFEIQDKLSDASTLERLALAFEGIVARSGDIKPALLKANILSFLSDLEQYASGISIIAKHPAINLLPKDAQLIHSDWTTEVTTNACAGLEDLAVNGRKLFKEFMIFMHELKNYNQMHEDLGNRIDERVALLSVGMEDSNSLQVVLEDLLEMDDEWKHGGLLKTRFISQQDIPNDTSLLLDDDIDMRAVTSLEVTQNYIILGFLTGEIWVFDHGDKPLRRLLGHTMVIHILAAQGHTLVSGAADNDLRVWNLQTGFVFVIFWTPLNKNRSRLTNGFNYRECIRVWTEHISAFHCLEFINEYRVVSGSRDANLRLWDIRLEKPLIIWHGHQATVCCIAVSGKLFVSGSYDATARVWKITEGRCLHILSGHHGHISSIATNNNIVATGSMDNSIRIWNIHTGYACKTFFYHNRLRRVNNTRDSSIMCRSYKKEPIFSIDNRERQNG